MNSRRDWTIRSKAIREIEESGQQVARDALCEMLGQLTPEYRRKFALTYAGSTAVRIVRVVSDMYPWELDAALYQAEVSLKKVATGRHHD